MPKFIIGYGWRGLDVIEANSIEDAKKEAAKRSMEEGILDDEIPDTTWAEPYDDMRAFDLGIIPPAQRETRQAPWWG